MREVARILLERCAIQTGLGHSVVVRIVHDDETKPGPVIVFEGFSPVSRMSQDIQEAVRSANLQSSILAHRADPGTSNAVGEPIFIYPTA